ncbi:alpha/beta hydrolase family protein [Hoeflea sp. TYP-13]|uniref:alpha/beta hydrolase family protein n=1 Tax=Hoeflea sp. TYP-13 TaxID=3230023 RepID=UPI0034C6ABD3
MFGNMIANMMVKPFQSPLFDSPANYGLEYENVEFKARDDVTIRGWLIKSGTDRVIIQSHFGVQCNRAGYSPDGKGLIKPWKQDIPFLRQAKYLSDNGYSVLMYDLRGHGESDIGTTPWVSWGPEEAKHVIAAVDYISKHPDYRDASLGLLSICMGSASTTYAYGLDDGLRKYPGIKAMIAVQPLLYSYFVDAFGMPGFLQRAGSKVTAERLGFDLNTRSFLPDARQITVPTMVVQNKNDPWTNLEMVKEYYDNLAVEKEMKWLDIEKSRFAAYDFVGREPEKLFGWFDRHMMAKN